MKVLMNNHSDQIAGRRGAWYASARLNAQCFHNQQNIPNAGRKKKEDIYFVPVKEQAPLIIYLCLVTQPKKLNEGVISFVF